MRGLILKYASKEFAHLDEPCVTIMFWCDRCKLTHQIWGTFGPAFTEGNFKTWHYELGDEDQKICKITPEIDFKDFCGLKTLNPWYLEVMIMEQEGVITPDMVAWLKSDIRKV